MKQFTLSDLGQGSAPVRGELVIKESTPVFQAYITQNLGDKVGNWKFWQAHLCSDGVDWYTQVSYWKQNQDGSSSKVQFSVPTLAKPKNAGKANATTSEQQARFELNSLVNKQRDKKYHLPGEDIGSTLPLPMLAHKYHERKHTVKFPVYAQPKFDGNRALHDGEKMWSRMGKKMIDNCVGHLLFDTQGHIIDGELILPQPYGFQHTQEAAKKFDPDLSPKLIHRVYDLMHTDMPFSERFKLLKSLAKNASESIVVAETVRIETEERLYEYHAHNLERGWEGTIVRTDTGGYAINKRHNQLLKLKSFDDDEFLVVGIETGEGSYEGLAKLVLITDDGKTFTANPRGTTEYRRWLYENPDKVIGTMWTVQYMGYSVDKDGSRGLPRHATAIAERIRDLQG